MAMSPSPTPVMGSRRNDRNQTNSPAPQQQQPQSKRDRKRSQIRDSYAKMEIDFSKNKDTFYRTHLHTLQIDMNLIGAADPHTKGVLPNDPLEIEALAREQAIRLQLGTDPPTGAGRVYAEFAKECNDALEERDAALVVLQRDVAVKLAEIQSEYIYQKKVALNEHNALSVTLRDRLINSVTNKKNRLVKDKEMDIGDSTAMLLHPNQFSLMNPSSPGGVHGKRATRNRRDAEEPTNFPESNKRKRKAADGDESIVPTRQRLENGTSVPTWLAERNHMIATQIESPLYSLEKLFTEKELAMTYNTAAVAAYSYIVRHYDSDGTPNGSSSTSDNEKPTGQDAALETEDIGSPTPGAISMERIPSHATRSTRGTFTSGFGIDAFDDVSLQPNLQALTRQIPKIPPMISQLGSRTFVAKNDAAPPAAGLSGDELASELDLIRRARQFNDQQGLGRNLNHDTMALRLLDEAAFPKDGKGRQRWVVSNNREHLPVLPRSGKGREREVAEDVEPMTKSNSRA